MKEMNHSENLQLLETNGMPSSPIGGYIDAIGLSLKILGQAIEIIVKNSSRTSEERHRKILCKAPRTILGKS